MKISKLIIALVIVLMLTALIIGCTKASDRKVSEAKTAVNEVTTDVKNDVNKTTNTAHEDWIKYKAEMEAKIADNETLISEYKVKMTRTSGKFASNYNKKIESLEKKNQEMQTKLDSYNEEGKESWDKFKASFDDEMDKLGTDIKKVTK